jgi:hypothetical protein
MAQTFPDVLHAPPFAFAKQQLQNPGRLYNLGNYLALSAAILHCLVSAYVKGITTTSEIGSFFFGSWPAMFTTLAVLIFFVSGRIYAKAWATGFPPIAKLNSQGHMLSAMGAVFVGVGLIGISQNNLSLFLAVTTTILHAGGKFGSWIGFGNDAAFKILPLLSRGTYIASLVLDIAATTMQNNFGMNLSIEILLPLALITAAAAWARADWLLRG